MKVKLHNGNVAISFLEVDINDIDKEYIKLYPTQNNLRFS
jgi:hypothetical protein